jgi:hypothetical protein
MMKSRFLQIGLLLHFNDNKEEEGWEKDSLHKIRPHLNILKITLGKYAIFGSELSLDEAIMANKYRIWYDDFFNRLDNLTLQLCHLFSWSSSTINMDDCQMSTTCAMKVAKKWYFLPGHCLY